MGVWVVVVWVVVVWVEVAVLVVCRNWVVGDETMLEGHALAAHR